MKKRILIVALVVVLAVGACVSLVACDNKKNDVNTLNIVVLNKGYGREWIDTLAEQFEAANPGITVNVEANGNAKSLISQNINAKNNTDDLYISVGSEWMRYAAQGKFATLDDIMDDEIDGVMLKNKVRPEYQNSIQYPDRNGDMHTYRLPWISATGGIFYNKVMFEENGWTVPTTYQELVDLCAQIIEDNIAVETASGNLETVKPFIYTTQNIDYFDYLVYTWWAQLAGEEAVDKFLQYDSPNNYSVSNPTYAKLKEATKLWYDLFKNSNNYASDLTNHDAQSRFYNGEAAMMINSDWLYNEVAEYFVNGQSREGFELAIMKTPAAPGAVETDILYTVGEDQYIAVPESSIKKDLAKSFIKLIVSDQGCKTFLTKANGVLAYNCNYTDADTSANSFLKNLVQTRNSYTTTFTNYPSMDGDVLNSTKMLYLTAQLDIWGSSGSLRPYGNLISNNPITLDQAFNNIHTKVTADWDTLKKNAGIK